MAIYKYVALKDNKELIESMIEATDERAARNGIRLLGYTPVKVYLEGDISSVVRDVGKSKLRLSLKEKRLFATSLQSMQASGIPIIEALSIIERDTSKGKLCVIAGDMRTMITNGYTLSQAMEKYSDTFGDVFLKLCKAGEVSGELDKVLARLMDLIKKQENIVSKIIAASVYPTFLVVLTIGVLAVLGNIVFPVLIGTTCQMGMDAPVETSILISIIDFFRYYWLLAVMFACGTGYGIYKFFKIPQVKRFVDNLLLKIPVVRDFVTYNALANFVAVIQVSYDSGVPLTECVPMAKATVNNYVIKSKCDKLEGLIYKGRSFSDSVKQADLMPADLLPMVVIGEQSGRLGEMLKEMSDIIDKKVYAIIDNLSSLVGPAFLVMMGGVVVFIMIAFYKFYFSMLGGIGSF